MPWRSERVTNGRSRAFQRAWRQVDATEAASTTGDEVGMNSASHDTLEHDMANLRIQNSLTAPAILGADLKMDNAMLRTRILRSEEEHNRQLEDLRKEYEMAAALRESKIKHLERQLELQKESCRDALETIHIQQDELNAATGQLERLKKEHEDNMRAMEQERNRHKEEIHELRETVQQLEADKTDLARKAENLHPLVLIGAAIRRRFIEKAAKKACSWDNFEHFPDESLIGLGNDAAHQPNIEADIALYVFDDHTGDERSRNAGIINAIYGESVIKTWPSAYPVYPIKIEAKKEMYNLNATLRIMLSEEEWLDSGDLLGLEPYVEQLLEMQGGKHWVFLSDRREALYEAHQNSSWDECQQMLDTDEVVQERLVHMRTLMENVVQLLGRRRGA
ncbi:hypothetical protein V8E51_004960 [Hyaloscypha variabilis]